MEVEIIGLPVDCCKEQTRVVDDNGEFVRRLFDNDVQVLPEVVGTDLSVCCCVVCAGRDPHRPA